MGEITLRDTLQQQPVLVKNLDQGFFKQMLKLEIIRGLKIPFEILGVQEWNLSARILLLKWKVKSSFTLHFLHTLLPLLSISLLTI